MHKILTFVCMLYKKNTSLMCYIDVRIEFIESMLLNNTSVILTHGDLFWIFKELLVFSLDYMKWSLY